MQPRRITAGRFKVRCLELLDEVADTRQSLLVTKRGRPVARVVPYDLHDLKGSATVKLSDEDLIHAAMGEWDQAFPESPLR